MRGDVRGLQITHGTMDDGCGGTKPATVVRVWVAGETFEEDGDIVVTAELRVDQAAPSELDGLEHFLGPYLGGFGLGDAA